MSDGDGNGNGKGKSRATPQKTETTEHPDSSLLSRITASATGLTRSTFNPPTGNELHSQAVTALSNSGKGHSFSNNGSTSSAWAESSKTSHQAGETGSAALRSGYHEQHIRQSENEFSSFLDGIDSFTPSENFDASPNGGLENAWGRSQAPLPLYEMRSPRRTVAEQQSRDGEEVLAILSSPAALENVFEAPFENQENYDWGLSLEQLSQLRVMTKDILPQPAMHSAVAADHPLNLNPQFKGETVEDMQHWREQWEGVLTGYADEVWGGLLPLVKQARQEMEETGIEGSATEKPTALRRLEAILGHLQKR